MGGLFVIEPIVGIVLGPYVGFLSTLLGVMLGHSIYLRSEAPVYEYFFTLGAPLGTTISALVFRRRWREVFAFYTLALAAYFLTPVAWELPLWGMWDVYFAYAALCITAIATSRGRLDKDRLAGRPHIFALCALIGLEADILFRILIFIPGQTYSSLYGLTPEVLQLIWTAGALVTPIQVATSVFVTATAGPLLVRILSSKGWLLDGEGAQSLSALTL